MAKGMADNSPIALGTSVMCLMLFCPRNCKGTLMLFFWEVSLALAC